jgi:Calcineurin-like phosphoesterase
VNLLAVGVPSELQVVCALGGAFRAAHSNCNRYVQARDPDTCGIVSDTHLSPAAPEADANWGAVVGYVQATACDVVIHVGDLSFDGAHNVEDLRHARRQLDRLPIPWHAVPGNHDVGDNPWPGSPDGSTMDGERNGRWRDVVGPDYWSLELDAWRMLAINAQLLGSGLPGEAPSVELARRPVERTGRPRGHGVDHA